MCFVKTDTAAPVIACPNDSFVSADPMANSTSVTWPPPVYMDNFRLGGLNVTHENGSIFFLGSTMVVYTAFDTSGNNGSCDFSVTVLGEDWSGIDINKAFQELHHLSPYRNTSGRTGISQKGMRLFNFKNSAINYRIILNVDV